MRTKQNCFTLPLAAAPQARFAARLQKSLVAAKVAVTGAATLEREFNQRYQYQPISRQSAYAWLTGKTRPTMDKIEVLAAWLQVSAHWLAFGTDVGAQIDSMRFAPSADRQSPNAAQYRERTQRRDDIDEQMSLKFARLTPAQRALVSALTDELLLTRGV